MTKEIVQKKDLLEKKFNPEEVKKLALGSSNFHFGMEGEIKKLGEEILPAYFAGKYDNKKANEELGKISRALSLDSGYVLFEGMSEKYHGLAFQMKQGLHKEFDCKTASEKAIVDMAVSSYISKLHYTNLLRLNQKDGGSDYNSYRCSLSKEIDRAHRQFMSTIETLKFMKQPAMKVNIKTNTAFVGENQQFNNNVETNESK